MARRRSPGPPLSCSITKEALDRIGQLYPIEKSIKVLLPDPGDENVRSDRSRSPRRWPPGPTRPGASCRGNPELAAAFRYMRARWAALIRCFDALDNNPAERALLRCVAIGRKNYLFAGSDVGGRRRCTL